MALSGSFSNYPASGFGVYCEWSGVQSVSGNYTDITLKVYLRYYSLEANAMSGCKVSINGTTETYTSPAIYDYPNKDTYKLIKTKTVRVPHNSDGTKSCALSASWVFNGYYGSSGYIGTITASTTVSINTIPRASSVSNLSIDLSNGKLSVNISRASTSFTHNLGLYYNDTSVLVTDASGNKAAWQGDGAGTIIHMLSQDMLEAIYAATPNSESRVFRLNVDTYSSGTRIGTTTTTVTGIIPDTIKPVINSFNPTLVTNASIKDIYIQNNSKVRWDVDITNGTGAVIKKCVISGQNLSSTQTNSATSYNAISSTLTSSGSKTYTVTVTDSRGRTAQETGTINVYSYSSPQIRSVDVYRCNTDGSLNESGTSLYSKIVLSFASIDERNDITVKMSYKSKSSASYSSEDIVYANGTNTTITHVNLNEFNANVSYDLKYTIIDKIGNATTFYSIITSKEVPFNIRKGNKGVAIGKVAEYDDMFEVADNWDVRVYGKSLVDFMYPVGSIYMSVNSNNPATYWGGTWVAWGSGRVPVGVNTSDQNFSTVEKTGGSSTIPSATSQITSGSTTIYTLTNDNDNLQPYITCYMWKRTA